MVYLCGVLGIAGRGNQSIIMMCAYVGIEEDSLRVLQYDAMVQSIGVLDGFGGMLDSERHPTHVT